ncbi:MAG: hypothetical protein JJU11_02780 [Candidatus Sumerlaeia bacterium]|nr:hypothetical protein [Candidatus Sumerlaeia bacterium]
MSKGIRHAALCAASLLLAGSLSLSAHASFTLSDDFGGQPQPLSNARALENPLGFDYDGPALGAVEPGQISLFTQTIHSIPAATVQLFSRNIEHIDVYIRMRHPNPGDLQFFLRHTRTLDDVQVVHLKHWLTGCSENDWPTTQNFDQDVFLYFDDNADSDINGACDRTIPSYAGRFFPTSIIEFPNSNGLSQMNGRRIDGTFELIIRDWNTNESTDSRGSVIDWGVVVNGLTQGDVAPRQLTPSTPNRQGGNGLLLEQDYVISAFHLLGYNGLDDRIASGVYYGDGTSAPNDKIGLFDSLQRYLDVTNLDGTLDNFVAFFRSSGTEFSRLDTAPANSFGDGIISVADFVQTARYVSGLDEVVTGTGPLSRSERIISAVVYDEDPEDPGKLILRPGLFRGDNQPTRVSVRMRSTNTETEVGFGLQYDPELLELVDVTRGPCLPENAIFQVDRNVDVPDGLVGLRVGVLPDARFLCLPVPSSVLYDLNEVGLANIKARNELSQPLLLKNSISSDYEIVRNGDALTAVFTVNYENEIGQDLRDFRFNILIDSTKLKLSSMSPSVDAITSNIGTNFQVIFPSGATIENYINPEYIQVIRETPDFEVSNEFGDYELWEVVGSVENPGTSGQLLELEFDIIAGLDANDQFTPNRPSIRLTRSNKPNSLVFNPFTTEVVDYYVSTSIIDTVTGSNFGEDGPMVDWDDAEFDRSGSEGYIQYGASTNQLRLSYNTQSITKFDFFLSMNNAPGEDDIDFFSPFGNFDITFEAIGASLYRVTGTLENESPGVLNGIFIQVGGSDGENEVEITSVTSATGDEFLFYTGAQGTIGVPTTVNLQSGDKVIYAGGIEYTPLSSSVDKDAPVVDLRPSQGSITVNPVAYRMEEGRLFLDIEINAATRNMGNTAGPIVGGYRFYLNFDGTILDLVEDSAEAGTDGFSGLPTFTNAQPVEYDDQAISLLEVPNRWTTNIKSILVEANDPESTLQTGTLLNLSFEVTNTSAHIPSVTLTSIPPVNNNIELAHFYFRALPGQGSVATELNFVNIFEGLYARNPAGTNLPGYFVDGALTLIDASDEFPTVRVRDTVLRAGEEGTVQVVLDSQGIENAAGFTLVFDNEDLELLSVTKGRDLTSGAFFFTNPNENNVSPANNDGRIKLLTALAPGNTFPEGERILANLRFRARASEDPFQTSFRFEKLGDRLEIVDPEALVLVSRFPEGTVNVVGSDCEYILEPAMAQFPTAGGEGEISLTTVSGCAWVASTSTPWINITSGFSGSNDGTIRYSVNPHTGLEPRTGTIEVAGEVFTINQSGCNYTLQPATRGISQEGGTGSFNVTTSSNCPWTAVSNNSWITISGNPFGTGNGTVQYTVAENVGQDRVGTIAVSGRTFTITQSVCSYALLSGAEESFPANGGAGVIDINTNSFCEWVVEKDASWITNVSPSSGSGPGTISFNVSSNNGIARTGLIRIGNLEVVVTQDGAPGCSYTINPTVMAFSNAGGDGRFTIQSPTSCTWQLEAVGTGGQPVSWLRIRSDGVGAPTDGAGAGTSEVRFTVDPNVVEAGATADREARLRVVGQGGPAIRVLQAGGVMAEPRFEFGFLDDSQGWQTEDFSAFFNAPDADNLENLSFTTTDNMNTFGVWRSPAAVFDRSAQAGDLLEANFTISTDRTDPNEVPATRVRFSTRDFHQTSELVLSSVAPSRLMPTANSPLNVTHLFKPVTDSSQLTFYFDVLNFGGMGAANSTVALEDITLSRQSSLALGEGRSELSRILSLPSHREGWTTGFVPDVMASPMFSVDSRGLRMTPDPAINHDEEVTFGFWIYEPQAGSGLPTVTIEDGRLYRVRFLVSARHSSQLDVNPNRVPTFRLRLNESSLNAATVLSVASNNEAFEMPTFDNKVSYDLYLVGREELAGSTLVPAIDMLKSPGDDDYEISIILESIQITSFPMD